LPIGIPQRLEFLECRNQFRPEHLRIKLSASLTVAMFTGEGSAIGDDQVGGLLHKSAEIANAVCRLQVEADAIVNTAVAEVSVQHALIAVSVDHLLLVA